MIGIWNFPDKSVCSIQVEGGYILRVDDDRESASLMVGTHQFFIGIDTDDPKNPKLRIDKIGGPSS